MKKTYPKHCNYCGKSYYGTPKNKWCCDACRQAAYRKSLELIEQRNENHNEEVANAIQTS